VHPVFDGGGGHAEQRDHFAQGDQPGGEQPRAEATAMAEIAVAAGVPPGGVTVETRSRDTIGNIWFTKLAVSRRWFAGIRPGDDAAIAAVLARDPPGLRRPSADHAGRARRNDHTPPT
jgi:hypothetical protein